MVKRTSNAPHILSPAPASGLGLRGVAKHSAATSRFAGGKEKKVQRALCTIFEENACQSSPYFSVKGWIPSPGNRHERRSISNVLLPALARLRTQECRDTPKVRKATPIKEKHPALCAAIARHRIKRDLDVLADELGTCQLQSAAQAGPAQAPTLAQTPAQGATALAAPVRDD